MSAARVSGAAGSLLIHAALLAGMLVQPVPPIPAQAPPAGESEGEDVDMRLVPTIEAEGDGLACANSYRGIGIMHWPSGAVIEVVAGGPADKAGLKVGDYLLNDAIFFRDQHEIGQRLPLRVDRDGKRLDLIVYVGKVCYEAPHTVPHLKEAP